MGSSILKYARNGALAGIGLYLMIAIPLLSLSLAYPQAQDQGTAAPEQAVQQLGKLAMAVLGSWRAGI